MPASTLIYYRGYATNTTGTGYSVDGTFTTAASGAVSQITFVGATSASGATVAIPAHQAGDLLILFAYRDGTVCACSTAPSLPAGWTNISSGGGGTSPNFNSSRLAYLVDGSGSTSSVTSTNATEIIVHVYHGQNSSTPIGDSSNGAGTSTTVTYPALTMYRANSTSWVAGFAGNNSIDTTIDTSVPSGMTRRTFFTGDEVAEGAGHDTSGGVSSWSATAVAVGGTTSTRWMARTVEIVSQ